jgi:catechol-2,3-dioxygenase
MQMAQVTIPGYRIDLMQFPGSQRPKDASPRYAAQGWVHIAFTVPDLEKALSFLQAAGTDVKGNRGGNNALMNLLLHDPEGNEIEIFSR